MSEKIANIKFNLKYYWTTAKPVLVNNLLLAEDWNKYLKINYLVSACESLSTVLTSVFGDPIVISTTLIDLTSTYFFPILSTVNRSTLASVSGISTIKINDDILMGTLDEHYLPLTARLVNTLNGKDGDIDNILTSIVVLNVKTCNAFLSFVANLGNYFEEGDQVVSSFNNGLTGNQWVISSLTINNKVYNNLNDSYYLDIDSTFGNNLFKRNDILPYATVETKNEDNSIVNVLMFREQYKISAAIAANTPLTLNNIVDWICISDENYNVIRPTTATLVNGTLTITSPSAGVIYYVTNK